MSRSLAVAIRKTIRRIKPAKEPTLVQIDDVVGVGGREQEIPEVVYQTAKESVVHPTHAKSIAEFRSLNPDLNFTLFDESCTTDYMRREWGHHPIFDLYSRAVFGQMRADIFRYCIVWDRGGYYIDFNKGINARLTELHPPGAQGIVAYETNAALVLPDLPIPTSLANPFNLLVQWGFGFRPRHAFLELLINRIVEAAPLFEDRSFTNPKNAILTLTGPGMFTRVFREYSSSHSNDDIVQAGEDFFGHGVFRLRGSKFLWEKGSHYSEQAELPILTPRPR